MALSAIAKGLRRLPGALVKYNEPFDPSNLIRCTSPGVNWTFGRTHGLPGGYSLMLWGPEKSGKSLLSNSFISWLHQSDERAEVLKFNIEMREQAQLTKNDMLAWGMDPDRLNVVETNDPTEVFDAFPTIDKLCKEGGKGGGRIRLIVIDPITGIRGRRDMVQESVEGHQIGDRAATLKIGLNRSLKTIRENNIAVIMTTHATPEMDRAEQMRGNVDKSTASNGVRHFAEYFMRVSKVEGKAGLQDELETPLQDASRNSGRKDQGEQLGHRIRVRMLDNSFGAKNRVAETTVFYGQGMVNQHEEVWRLGKNWGVITRDGSMYTVGDKKFNGKPATLKALAADPELQKVVMSRILELEKTVGQIQTADAVADKIFDDGEQEAE